MISRYKIITTKKEVKQLIKACIETKYCCFDFETNAEPIYNDTFYPTILSVSFQVGSSVIIPLEHFESPLNGKWLPLLQYFGRKVIENREITKVAWNWKFDNQIMHKYGIFHAGRALDGMLAKYLLDEERPNGLKEMVDRYLPEMSGYENYEGSKMPWDKKPLEGLSKYAGQDTDATLRLTLFFEKKLIDLGFYPLYRNLIMMASRVFEDMERWGMKLDVELNDELQISYAKRIQETEEKLKNIKKVRRFEKAFSQERIQNYIDSIQQEIDQLTEEDEQGNARKIASREDKIKRLTIGDFQTKSELALKEPINFSSQQQMVQLLYTHPKGLKLPILKYTKDKYKRDTDNPSTAEDTLIELKSLDKNGFIETLLELRGLNTITSTFILGIRDKLGSDGRIHPKFNIHGTVTGRASSNDPNFQNLPRTSTNPDIKRMMIPTTGNIFLMMDYSQAELRVLAHLAKETTMLEWFRTGKDIHLASACKKYNEDYDKIIGIYEDEQHPEYKTWKVRRKQAKCYTGDTEILTTNGWQRLDSYDNTSLVAQYHFDSEKIEFVKPENYGKVLSKRNYAYVDRNIDMNVTHDHKTLFISRNNVKVKTDFENLVGKNGYMPCAGFYEATPRFSEDITRFISMFTADGNLNGDGKIRYGFSKERKIKRCKELLNRMGVHFTERIDVKGNTHFYIPKKENRDLYTSLLMVVGKDKKLSWDSLNLLNMPVFLEEAGFWDSYLDTRWKSNRVSFSTVVEQTADVMQAMGTLCGIRVVKRQKGKKSLLTYKLSVSPYSRVNLRNAKLEKFKKPVDMWSVTVPSRNLVTRRNNKVVLSGNTINFGIAYEQTAMKLSESLSDPEKGIVVSVAEAQVFLDEFFKDFPNIKKYIEKQHKFAKKNGYVKTMFGRKRRLPNAFSDNYREFLEAMRFSSNAPIQGTATDFALFSSILMWEKVKKGEFPEFHECTTVHDSLVFEINPSDITPKLIYDMWSICKNPGTKKYFGFQIDDVEMAVDFGIGRTYAEELPFVPGYDYNKLLSDNFSKDDYYEEHKKVKNIEIKDYPKYFKQYFNGKN